MNRIGNIIDKEKGVYVVCNDKALLDKINRMLKRQGIIGISDAEGKMHYMVDARRSTGKAARQVLEFVNEVKNYVPEGINATVSESVAEDILSDVIGEVFSSYNLDFSLSGTRILAYLVRYEMYKGGLKNRTMKEIYNQVEWEMQLGYMQVERNVRYAVSKSKFADMKIKTIRVIQILMDAVYAALTKKRLKMGKVSNKKEAN